MNFEDFDINTLFFTASGTWACTDKGTRTIVAIRVDNRDISWLSGPPYMVAEVVFDENDMGGCWLGNAPRIEKATGDD